MLQAFMVQKLIGLILRHTLTSAGVYLAAEGYATETDFQTLTSSAVAATGIAWSIWEKARASKSLVQ